MKPPKSYIATDSWFRIEVLDAAFQVEPYYLMRARDKDEASWKFLQTKIVPHGTKLDVTREENPKFF